MYTELVMVFLKVFAVAIIFFQLLLLPAFSSAQQIMALESPSPAIPTAAETIDVYAMFWPLVPGRTMGDSMYPLKLLKETIGDWLSVGDIKKAEYYITLSEKRILETNKLFINDKDYNNGAKTLELNQQYLKKTFDLIKKAEKAQQKVDSVKGKFTTSLENQEKIFKLIQSQVPDDQKGQFNKAMENINSYMTLLP